jgi:hypothetical protein
VAPFLSAAEMVGLEHAYRNEGMKPARMLILISPPGFERYFDAIFKTVAPR